MRLAPVPRAPELAGVAAAPPRWRRRPTFEERVDGARPGDKVRAAALTMAATFGGVVMGVAWWVPETVAGALLGWVATALLVVAARAGRSYLPAYGFGLACNALGFYWIFGTVAGFGGFGAFPAALIFALYVAIGGAQFLLFAFLHRNLGPGVDAWALRAPVALVLSEFASVRLFRWHFGHTQAAFTPFVQVADLGGSLLVSFLMAWLIEAAVRAVVFRERRREFALPLVACLLAVGYGLERMRAFAPARGGGREQEVVVVQGNVPLDAKLAQRDPLPDIARYRDLTRGATRPGALVVWPEGAIPVFLPADVGSSRAEPALPWSGDGAGFLVGAYAEDRGGGLYNAAFAVDPDGKVPAPYYKQILIPFGESMPFAEYFPWLRRLNANAGVLTPGAGIKVFSYALRRPDGTTSALKVAPLICYEDTVPGPAREASLAGAELLVNLTYDTWFGRSAAAREHHLIATFRAIENRRYLVRATNTGLSAVVDPLGRTIGRLPEFAEGTLSATVLPIGYRSLYARYVGERPWWALLAVTLAAIVAGRARRARAAAPAALP